MAGKRQAVRDDLTERLLAAARGRIEAEGLSKIRTRDITNDAGCGLGTIYKCFSDVDDLILRVNSRTLADLARNIEKAIKETQQPREQLQSMARSYLRFAIKNRNLWLALFEHRMPTGVSLPDWHLKEHQALLAYIAKPLSRLQPHLSDAALELRTRSVFAAVHGLIETSLEGRFISISQQALRAELAELIDIIVSGIQSTEK